MAKVDFLHNAEDLEVMVLASLGFSTEFIKQRTKLTASQILYRLRLCGVKRVEYRNGTSKQAVMVINTMRKATAHTMKRKAKSIN